MRDLSSGDAAGNDGTKRVSRLLNQSARDRADNLRDRRWPASYISDAINAIVGGDPSTNSMNTNKVWHDSFLSNTAVAALDV